MRPPLSVLTLIALAGCRLYSRETIDTQFLEALGYAGRDEAAAARQPSRPIWDAVEQRKSLNLADAFRLTLAQSERIARAAEGYLQSLTLQDRAIAAVLPTIGVQGTAYFQNKVPAASGTFFTAEPNRQEIRFTLTQPLFHGLKEFAGWRMAQDSIEQSKTFFETERRLVFQIVAQAFYNELFLERQLKILEDAVKNSRDRLREMQARQAQGIARKTEVLLIETQVASDESQLSRGRQALDVARTQMTFLLGRALTVPLLDDLLEPAVPAQASSLVQEALADRSDLKNAEAALRIAEANLSVVSSEHFPQADFTGDWFAYRRNFSDFNERTEWDALFTVTLNVFKGGDIRAREVAAESQIRVARLTRDELARQIEADVTSALLTWRADQDLIKTLEIRERTSGENYKQVVTEYRQGIAGVSNLEVLVAQNQYLAAQLELERQKIQSKLDWFQLENARGRIPVR